MSLKQIADNLQAYLREKAILTAYRIYTAYDITNSTLFVIIKELETDMKSDDYVGISDWFECLVDDEGTKARIIFTIKQYQSVELDYLNDIMKKC